MTWFAGHLCRAQGVQSLSQRLMRTVATCSHEEEDPKKHQGWSVIDLLSAAENVLFAQGVQI